MRLKLLAAALGMIGIAVAATGAARAGGVCVLSDQERLSPIKMLKWSVAAVKAGHRPACDLLTYESGSDDAGTIVFPFLRFRTNASVVTVVIYVLEFEKTGASNVFRQVMRATEDGKREFGLVEQVWRSKPSTTGAAAFKRMMADLGPLRAVSEQKSWKSNFFKPDGHVFDENTFSSDTEARCEQMLDSIYQEIGFLALNGVSYFKFGKQDTCNFRYREITNSRISKSRESALSYSGFSPSEPEPILP